MSESKYVMHVDEFVGILKDIVEHFETSYMLGCFGQPANTTNISRAVARKDVNNKPYEKGALSIKDKGFMFDCVCLIKAVLWGWNGSLSKTYGGAIYTANGVPDIGADSMIKQCKGVSTNFSNIQKGEAVWLKGHIGVYIGDGKVIECTPKWSVAPGVKISYLENLGFSGGYSRTWTKHGLLPWVDYTEKVEEKTDRYQTLEQIPEYAKSAIEFFVEKGILKGTESGFDLSKDMVRILVILHRLILDGVI